MPPLDLELADELIRRAASAIHARVPASYPANPSDAYRLATNRPGASRGAGVTYNVATVAEALLLDAARLERAARDAQGELVRALRHLIASRLEPGRLRRDRRGMRPRDRRDASADAVGLQVGRVGGPGAADGAGAGVEVVELVAGARA